MSKSKRHQSKLQLAGKTVITELQSTEHLDAQAKGEDQMGWLWFWGVMAGGVSYVCYWLFVLGGLEELRSEHFVLIPIAVLATITAGAGILLLSASNVRNKLLRVGKVDERGIRLGRCGDDRNVRSGLLIRWDELKAVDLESCPVSQDHLLIEVYGNKVYKILVDNAFDWVNEGTLIDAIKTYAKDVEINLPAKRSLQDGGRDDPRYTELWLEYFSSSKSRERRGSLKGGDTLSDGEITIRAVLAHGGQGTVYLATGSPSWRFPPHQERPEHFVLKEYIIPSVSPSSIEYSEAEFLRNEVEILTKLEHPRIVKVFDCFIEDHRGYIVLEHVTGVSLRNHVRSRGPVAERIVIDWSYQVSTILEYLHGQAPPVVHRDLTPDNLMLEDDGKIKLIDFTVAHQSTSTRLTQTAGKQAYMPLEQIAGEVCPGSDFYALGCTMFFLLTGEDPTPLSPLFQTGDSNSITLGLKQIMERLTCLSLDERLISAAELKSDLERVANQSQNGGS